MENIGAKKKKYNIHFRSEWGAQFNWLVKDDSLQQGKKCSLCGVPIFGNLSHIVRHSQSSIHKKKVEAGFSTPKIETFVANRCVTKSIEEQAKQLEVRLCLFVAEHNLSFRTLDHLGKCITSIKDSKIVSKFKINRMKGQKIITTITGPKNSQDIAEITQRHYYSIIIDESTDIAMQKNLAIVVRVFNGKCLDRFLNFAPVTSCSAQGIFDAMIQLLKDHSIPLENMLGFAADNCGVMMGKRNGVQMKLKTINPKMFIMGDVCHNLNLSAEAAAATLPRQVENMMLKINHHFCHSSSRIADFAEFQQEFGTEVHTILRLAPTRWLSRQKVVDRILEQWTSLQYYFGLCNFDSGYGNESNRLISDGFSSPTTKMYFLFLSYILKLINDVNIEMQSEEPKIHILNSRLSNLMIHIFRNFIPKSEIDANSIDSIDLQKNMAIENIFCGTKTEIFYTTQGVSKSDVLEFKTNVLKFYVKFCEDFRARFNFENEVIHDVEKFTPQHVFSGATISILSLIIKLFPDKELQKAEVINNEYRALANCSELKSFEELSISDFWLKVSKIKNTLNEHMFLNVFRIAQGILSLPHSSACVERVFSIQNLIKTKCRNRLQLKTCASLLQTRDLIRSKQEECFDFDMKTLANLTPSNISVPEEALID